MNTEQHPVIRILLAEPHVETRPGRHAKNTFAGTETKTSAAAPFAVVINIQRRIFCLAGFLLAPLATPPSKLDGMTDMRG